MSYKWKFKDVLTLSPTSSNYITIRSNGEVFSRINITDSQLLYGQFIVYEASSGWTNEAYKTIEMDNYPAGDLLQFLQSNAILLPSSNVNKVDLNGVTVLDLTSDTVTPETLLVGTTAHNAKGEIITGTLGGGITPSGNKAITATTSTQTGIDVTNYATVSVAPTPSETKSVTTNGDVTPSSGKLLSKVTVNVPTGTERDSSDLTVSGATVNVPAGLYSSAASKSVASGTAGTPTASKSAVSNNSVTVTPSVTNTEGYITGGTKTGTGVKVSASELVSGNKAITPSETAQSGIDVTNFKTASVSAISSTYVGSGVTRKAEATVAPSTSEQTVCASGVYTTGAQKVSAITPSIVGNLNASSFAASIVAAVEGKGVTVPDGTLLDGMAALIDSIEAGGGGINLGDYFTNITVASITPAEDMQIGSGVLAALNLSSDLRGAVFVVANNKYRKSISDNGVRLAFYPRFVYAGIWRIVYGTGTSSDNERWAQSASTSGGSTYLLKAGIKYEIVYIEAPY